MPILRKLKEAAPREGFFAVYRRYAIASDADLQAATQRLAGTISGSIAGRAVDSGPVSR